MSKPYKIDLLRSRIQSLEIQRDTEFSELKESVVQVKENFKPKNLLKRAFASTVNKQSITDSVSGVLVGLATGYLVKKTIFRKSDSTLMNLVAMFVQSFVTNEAVKHSDEISSKSSEFLSSLITIVKELYAKYKAYKAEQSDDDEDVEENYPATAATTDQL